MTTAAPPSVPPMAPPKGAAPATSQPSVIGSLSRKMVGPRIVLNAVEGFGKTSTGAYAPKPVLLMAEGETGAETLCAAGLIPEIPAANIESWPQLLSTIKSLEDTDHQTVILDALSGFEKLCHVHVCHRDFDGDWGEKGFLSYHKGYDVSVNDWLLMLSALDHLRKATGATILLLSHTQIRTHKNPLGEDFDRYVADCHPKTWAPTAKWADAVLFGNFLTVTQKDAAKRVRGVGTTDRVIYTTRRDAWDAKNRFGMPDFLQLDKDPSHNWTKMWSAVQGAK